MTTLHHVKKARKPIKSAGIKKGDSYYWWQFAYGTKQVSKERPARSQYATRSEHLGAIYDLEDEINAITIDDMPDSLDEFISQIESIRETCEERLENIPDQLKDAPAGQTLQEYIDALENWQSELEGIDMDIDEDALRQQADDEYAEALENCRPATLEDEAEEPEFTADEIFENLLNDRKQEILDEIQGVSSGL